MRLILLLLLLTLPSLVHAQAQDARVDFSELKPETAAMKADKIIDPLTFLGSDGKIYRLSGLDIPGIESGGSEITAQAAAFLEKFLAGQEVRLYLTKDQTKGRQNRMGQLVAQVTRKDGQWVQGALLREGLARVRTTPSNPEMAAQMLVLESAARAQKKGIWADQEYAVVSPGTVKITSGFSIVEGRIFSVAARNNEVFLNFSPDWKKDFTIGLSSEMRRQMARKNLNPLGLAHKTVRVRGFIEDRNGPFITLDHPEQIEILDATLPAIDTPKTGSFKTPDVPVKPEIKTPEIKKPEAPTAKPAARKTND